MVNESAQARSTEYDYPPMSLMPSPASFFSNLQSSADLTLSFNPSTNSTQLSCSAGDPNCAQSQSVPRKQNASRVSADCSWARGLSYEDGAASAARRTP